MSTHSMWARYVVLHVGPWGQRGGHGGGLFSACICNLPCQTGSPVQRHCANLGFGMTPPLSHHKAVKCQNSIYIWRN